MKPILKTSIACLCVAGIPRPAYGDDTIPQKEDRVEGEIPPDFSFIDKKAESGAQEGQGSQSEPPVAPPEPKPPVEPPAAEIPAVDPNDLLPIPASKPQGEEEMPDPKEQAEARKREKQEADEAKKAEDEEKAKVEAAKTAPPAAEPQEVKLPTDEEVEAMQPKPGAPANVIKDFKQLKETVLKPAIAEARRLKAEVEKLKAAPAITDEIKQKLERAEDDRAWREAFELQNDPVISAQAKATLEKADDGLIAFLRDDPRLKLSQDAIDEWKKIGIDSEEGRKTTQKILDTLKSRGDDLLFDDVKQAFRDREGVKRQQAQQIEQLRSKQADLGKIREEREMKERGDWSQATNQGLIKAIGEIADETKELFVKKEIPSDATPEQKKAIESHNEKIDKELVPEIHNAIRAVYGRDPSAARYIVQAMRVPALTTSLKTATDELAKAKARIAELEGDATKMRRVASPSRMTGAPPPTTEKPQNDLDMSADESIDAFLREKGRVVK